MGTEERLARLEKSNRRIKCVNLLLALLLVAGATLAMSQDRGVQDVIRAKRIELVGKRDTAEKPENIIVLAVSNKNRGWIRINSPSDQQMPVVLIDSSRITLHDDDGVIRFSASKGSIKLESSIGEKAFSVSSGSMKLCNNSGKPVHFWGTDRPFYKISDYEGKLPFLHLAEIKLTFCNYDGKPVHSFESNHEGGSYQMLTPDGKASVKLSVSQRDNNTPEISLKRSKKEKKINHWRK